MEQIAVEIRVGHADPGLNALLLKIGQEKRPFERRFSQGEDFFLHLERPLTIPHFQIHHDVRQPIPSPAYLTSLASVMEQVIALAPQVLKGLTYYFDPAEILRPAFYHVYRIGEAAFLYMLRLDLIMRPSDATVIERGTNDVTPSFTSPHLFVEATVVPLDEIVRNGNAVKSFRVKQTISQTWIGEFGRGYFQQGIWMDADLTKFFTRLFLPADKRIYPYYPFQCKYKTLCESLVGLGAEERAAAVPLLYRALVFLEPEMEAIQAEIKNSSFSEDLAVFQQLKKKVPPSWYETWQDFRVERYLNEADMKEFRIEG